MEMCTASDSAKLVLLSNRLKNPGPPLHLALDRVAVPRERCAISSLLCGDWFLAVYAHNFFAKNLLPCARRHLEAVAEAGATCTTICLPCWHFRRDAHLEDEFHMICSCPEYDKPRLALKASLPPSGTLNSQADVLDLLSGSSEVALASFGRFCARARQIRRSLKLVLEQDSSNVERKAFSCKRVAWKLRRRPACRHGVLFTRLPAGGCKCMAPHSSEADWTDAKFMPALDAKLRIITAVPFDRSTFVRLNILQAEARRRGW